MSLNIPNKFFVVAILENGTSENISKRFGEQVQSYRRLPEYIDSYGNKNCIEKYHEKLESEKSIKNCVQEKNLRLLHT